MFGQEAAAARTMLQISYPMENGIVRDWKDTKRLWNYIFKRKLKIDPEGRYFVLTEPPENPIRNLVEMCRVLLAPKKRKQPGDVEDDLEYDLEEGGFGAAGVYVATQAVLALYAQGERKTNGMMHRVRY